MKVLKDHEDRAGALSQVALLDRLCHVIHNDLKPSNILLQEHPLHMRIADSGNLVVNLPGHKRLRGPGQHTVCAGGRSTNAPCGTELRESCLGCGTTALPWTFGAPGASFASSKFWVHHKTELRSCTFCVCGPHNSHVFRSGPCTFNGASGRPAGPSCQGC